MQNRLRRIYPLFFLSALFMMMGGDFPRFPFGVNEEKLFFLIFSWPKLYIVLFCLSFLLYLLSGEFETPIDQLRPLAFPILLCSLAFLISSIFAVHPYLSIEAYLYYLAILFFLFMFSSILNKKMIVEWSDEIIFLAIIFLAIKVIAWRWNEGINTGTYHIKNNAWLGKLQISWILCIFNPFLLHQFLSQHEHKKKIYYGAGWLISGIALLSLYARAASALFLIVMILYCFFYRRFWIKLLPLAAIFMIIILLAAPRAGRMFNYVASSIKHFNQETGVVRRIGIWAETLRMFRDRPWTGIGLGNYDEVAYTRYHTRYDLSGKVRNYFHHRGWHAHNLILHLLAETGILGMMSWLFLWYTIVSTFIRTAQKRHDIELYSKIAMPLCSIGIFFILSMTEHLMAIRVHESMRMNLAFYFFLIYCYYEI